MSRCLYDVLFSMPSCEDSDIFDEDSRAEKTRAISEIFSAVMRYALRLYGKKMSLRDRINARYVIARGNATLQLSFVLMMLVHETSQQFAIMEGATQRCRCPEEKAATIRKISAFYRIVSSATRDAFESPFTERNSPLIIHAFLRFCTTAWLSMNATSMTMHATFFSGHIDSDDFDDELDPLEQNPALVRTHNRRRCIMNAADIVRDRFGDKAGIEFQQRRNKEAAKVTVEERDEEWR